MNFQLFGASLLHWIFIVFYIIFKLLNSIKSRFYCRRVANFKVLQVPNPTDVSMICMSKIRLLCVTFRMYFSSNFVFFQEPFQETVFWGSKRRSIIKSLFFGAILDPSRSQNPSLERHFQPKRRSRLGSRELGFSSRSQPGHDLVLKASQASFWNRFGSILEQICMHFGLV